MGLIRTEIRRQSFVFHTELGTAHLYALNSVIVLTYLNHSYLGLHGL
jgi:hypothetical protein